MSTIQDDDKFLVQRGENSYRTNASELMSTIDTATDWMLIQRGTDSYKVSAADVKDQLGAQGEITPPVVVLTPPNGAGMAGQDVTPAAEGIIGVVEKSTETTIASFSGGYGGPTAPPTGSPPPYGFNCQRTSGYIIFDPPLSGSKIEAYGYTDGSGEPDAWSINSGQTNMTLTAGSNYAFQKINTGVVSLSRLDYTWSGTNNDGFLPGFFVDDEWVELSANFPQVAASLTYTTNSNLGLLTVGQAMTQQPAYTPVTDTINTINGQILNLTASNWGSPGRALNGDQSTKASSLNFSATDTDEWGTIDFGEEIDISSFNAFTRIIAVPNQFRLVDEAGNVVHFVQDFPTQGANPTVIYSGLPIKARYYQQRIFHQGIWTSDDFHTFNLNGPVVSASNIDVAAGTGTWDFGKILTFNSNKDLVNFRAGDVVQDPDVKITSTDDIANNKLTVSGGTWSIGDTVTGPACQGTGEYVSYSGPTLELANVAGRWCVSPDVAAQSNDTYTEAAPSWDAVTFQSANGPDQSTAFSAADCVLRSIVWSLGSSDDGGITWGDTTEYSLSATVSPGQEVLPWSGVPDLDPGKTYRVKVRYEADSSAVPVESTWNVFKTSGGDGPIAKMSGLRFDRDRNTAISRGRNTESGKITFSAWYKNTTSGAKGTIFGLIAANGTKTVCLEIEANGTLGVDCFGANFTGTLSLNVWSHIVVTADQQEGKLYINGVLANSATLSYNTAPTGYTVIGAYNASGTANELNGYVSEAYFVDGQALNEKAFGKFYSGLWGPLPNTTVVNNITHAESPYDQRPNTGQVWSDIGFVSSSGSPQITKAFNGNSSDWADTAVGGGVDDQYITALLGLTLSNETVEVFAGHTLSGFYVTIDGSNQATVYATGSEKSKTFGPFTGTLTSITVTNGTDTSSRPAGLAGVKVGNRLLVDDGVLDITQNWSDAVILAPEVSMSANGPSTLFDGDLSTGANTSEGTYVATFDFSDNPPQGAIRFYVTAGNNGGTPPFKVNGSDSGMTWSDSPGWVSPDGNPTQLESFSFGNIGPGSSYLAVSAVEVGGKILVDSGAQWDNSEVWSDAINVSPDTDAGGWTGWRPAEPLAYGFNGDLSNAATGNTANTGVTLDLTSLGLSGTLRVHVLAIGNTSAFAIVNGVSKPYPQNRNGFVDFGDVGNITTIILRPMSGAPAVNFAGIEVNGKILVDPGSFGDNGFYLPFDPAQTGAIYSDGGDSANISDGNWKQVFDGDLPQASTNSGVAPSQNSTVTWDGNIPADGKNVKIAYKADNVSIGSVTINGVTKPTVAGSYGTYQELDFGTLSSDITSMSVTRGDVGSFGGIILCAVYVDGFMIVDHSGVGVDFSGNKNHFLGNNLAVGNTSQVWSKNLLLSTSDDWPSNYLPYEAFDGNPQTAALSPNQGTTVTFNSPFADVTSLKIQVRPTSAQNTATFRISGTGITDTTIDATEAKTLYPITLSSTTIGNIKVEQMSGSETPGFTMIEINGVLLIDANIQDSVVDTPVKNYSVLQARSGEPDPSNGNLVLNGNGYSVLSAGGKSVYYEATLGGSANWHIRVYQTEALSAYIRNDGGKTNLTLIDGAYQSFTDGDIIGVVYNSTDDSMAYYKNGIFAARYTVINLDDPSNRFLSIDGGNARSTHNFGQQPFAASNVTHDLAAGTVEIDGVTYNTLYQELAGYQVAGGYFYDEANQQAVRGSDLRRRFGITSADPRLGIYDLTEVPTYQVSGYEKTGQLYKPLHDYSPELKSTEQELEEVQKELRVAKVELRIQTAKNAAKDLVE